MQLVDRQQVTASCWNNLWSYYFR